MSTLKSKAPLSLPMRARWDSKASWPHWGAVSVGALGYTSHIPMGLAVPPFPHRRALSVSRAWPTRPGEERSRPRPGSTRSSAMATSSVGARFRLSPATCDVSNGRSGDRRSTDEHGLQRFPLPGPDAVVPVPQDALPWTCWCSPEPDRGVGRRWFDPSRAPPRNVPRWDTVKGVFGYQSAPRREFPRNVASSTQFGIVAGGCLQ